MVNIMRNNRLKNNWFFLTKQKSPAGEVAGLVVDLDQIKG